MEKFPIVQIIRLLSACLVLVFGAIFLTSFLLLESQRQEEPPAQIGCGTVGYSQKQYTNLDLLDSIQLAGKQIFMQNCFACHSQYDEVVVGPGLEGITARRNKKWIIEWIQNPRNVLKKGDKYALRLYEKFDKVEMPAFKNIKSDDVNAILAYIEWASSNKVVATSAPRGVVFR